ncbi:extracellular solute-binding protein [Paractinoplanes atraurantiacus]|uniref:Raffinose/stachyose/melibiose transport system substrate-binding protein n=1 Tax=Paractinoplanes atraurantiacus TaxID=1036182 RepID=A0A285I0M2_9ACTN|nr:extracellular solute-binding protein [Actinoplanes atraurantiacus]SNY41423.1 raffinose/stachyose/melibiose transport system substrate-binding protein [Actinoplanes atraurantiacus]
MINRRNFLGLAAGTAGAAALAACGSSGPEDKSGGSSGGGGGAASYWSLSGEPGEPIRTAAIDRFNKANPDTKITPTFFQNDAYKQKIKTALGADQGPTMIWGWGGGGLKEYVTSNQVEDLTDWLGQNAAVKDKILPSSFGAATVNGKIYALPIETVQPIVLFYNKKVFEKVGVQPPKSWGEIMALVPKFNEKKIAPFSLGGQSRWTNMMWLEFLLDRTAGSEVFDRVFAGEKDAWSDPAVLDMLTKIQDLVKANGFQKGFSSTTADSNADQALLYTGKAAMMLHGSWSYGIQKADGGNFVKDGGLGWMNFPPVEGGKGDPSNTVGNPGQYLSISSKASTEAKDIAKKFFSTTLVDDEEKAGWVKSGGVPVLKNSDSLFTGDDAAFLKDMSAIAGGAKVFAQSWDQALSPTAAETLLDNIAKLFQLQVTPQQWVDAMNGVIGK